MDLSDLNFALRETILQNDVKCILISFDSFDASEIYPSIQKGMYNNPKELYDDIVNIVSMYSRVNDLIDMMPFIDEYIETYFNY